MSKRDSKPWKRSLKLSWLLFLLLVLILRLKSGMFDRLVLIQSIIYSYSLTCLSVFMLGNYSLLANTQQSSRFVYNKKVIGQSLKIIFDLAFQLPVFLPCGHNFWHRNSKLTRREFLQRTTSTSWWLRSVGNTAVTEIKIFLRNKILDRT